jgi:hypothetical protein
MRVVLDSTVPGLDYSEEQMRILEVAKANPADARGLTVSLNLLVRPILEGR